MSDLESLLPLINKCMCMSIMEKEKLNDIIKEKDYDL